MFSQSTLAALSCAACVCVSPPAVAQPIVQGSAVVITATDIEGELLTAPAAARQQALATARQVKNMATSLYLRRSLAQQALSAQLDQDPMVKQRLEAARETVLAEARVRQLEESQKPDPAAILAYARTLYLANQDRYTAKESVRVRHILVGKNEENAKDQANQLLLRLRGGADFAELAREKSADKGSAANGGDLGLVERGRTVPPFEEAAFALTTPGQLSEVVETSFGYHIIKLEERRPAGVRPFEEVREALTADAALKLANRAREEMNEKLLEGARFDEEAIRSLARGSRR